jgi:predicted aldo/keto reductase-like oxidoreductase
MRTIDDEPPISIKPTLPQCRDRIRLNAALPPISPICIGMVADPSVITAAFDHGCNFFFVSADMHWPRYQHTRQGISDLIARVGRDQIVVAATVYVTQPEFLSEPFVELVDETAGLGHLDIVVAGGSYGTDLVPRIDVLRHHRATGRFGARAIGASFHDRSAARVAIAHRMVDLALVRFNAAHPGARAEVLPHANASAPRIFNFKSTSGYVSPERLRHIGLTDDDWMPAITDHYRYALSHVGIDGVLCSPSSRAEVEALDRALELGSLTADDCQYLEKLCLLASGAAKLG